MIDEHLVSFLDSDPAIAALAEEIAIGEVPEPKDGDLLVGTYIWCSQFDEEDELDLDGESGLTRYRMDMECCSTSTAKAKQLARLVKKKMQGYSGTFGSVEVDDQQVAGEVDAIYVESKDDDYVPINSFNRDDITVIAMDILIYADDAIDDIQAT